MTQGFIESQGGLDINEFDEETMFIALGQFPDPVGEFRILLLEVQRVLVRLSLMELFVKARLTEEGFTVSSLIIMGNHIGHDFQSYGFHAFLLVLLRKHNKGMIGIQRWSIAGDVLLYLIERLYGRRSLGNHEEEICKRKLFNCF